MSLQWLHPPPPPGNTHCRLRLHIIPVKQREERTGEKKSDVMFSDSRRGGGGFGANSNDSKNGVVYFLFLFHWFRSTLRMPKMKSEKHLKFLTE
jgi:hypothetical protein